MKKKLINFAHFVRIRRGFTLTEVLMAMMIVGLIGVALASLSRSAAKEGGVGRSKVLLRNNLSSFMRTLRNDLAKASNVARVSGKLDDDLPDKPVELLIIEQNLTRGGREVAMDPADTSAKVIFYCFVRGNDQKDIVPSSAYRGGNIYRMESFGALDCDKVVSDSANLVLTNVKYIPYEKDFQYPVPLFELDPRFSQGTALFNVRLIVELPSTPLVNDVVEETFAAPMGY